MLPVGSWNLIEDRVFLMKVIILHGLNKNKNALSKKPEKKQPVKKFWLMSWNGYKKILKLVRLNQRLVSMLMTNCWRNQQRIKLQLPIFIFR